MGIYYRGRKAVKIGYFLQEAEENVCFYKCIFFPHPVDLNREQPNASAVRLILVGAA